MNDDQRAEREYRWVRRACVAGFALVAVAVALLVCVVAARAEVDGPPVLARDYRAAIAWWDEGAPAGCESVSIGFTTELPPGALGQSWPPVDGPDCRIAVLAAGEPRCVVEEVVFHEVGHLLGRAHSTDPVSIMYPAGDQQQPLCAHQELRSYQRWLRRAADHCRGQVGRRRFACAEWVALIRQETRARARVVARLRPAR